MRYSYLLGTRTVWELMDFLELQEDAGALPAATSVLLAYKGLSASVTFSRAVEQIEADLIAAWLAGKTPTPQNPNEGTHPIVLRLGSDRRAYFRVRVSGWQEIAVLHTREVLAASLTVSIPKKSHQVRVRIIDNEGAEVFTGSADNVKGFSELVLVRTAQPWPADGLIKIQAKRSDGECRAYAVLLEVSSG